MYIPLYLYSFFAQIFEFPIREDSNACCTASLTFRYFVQNVCRIQSRPCRRHRVHQTETITRVQIHFLYNRYGYSRGSFAIPNDLFQRSLSCTVKFQPPVVMRSFSAIGPTFLAEVFLELRQARM